MKIYTKGGDKGQTSLFGGSRVSKDDVQIESYGTVDELNTFIGLLINDIDEASQNTFLKSTQAILFDIGSHLASDGKAAEYLPKLEEKIVEQVETHIDTLTSHLPELKSFIMPGGNERIARAHVCRTVSRRAERRVVSLSGLRELNPIIVTYLNRLSDYFFVLARTLSLWDGVDEVKWNPKG